jgi:hypothetical protein
VIWELAMNAFIHFTESSELSICLKQAVCFICLPTTFIKMFIEHNKVHKTYIVHKSSVFK